MAGGLSVKLGRGCFEVCEAGCAVGVGLPCPAGCELVGDKEPYGRIINLVLSGDESNR